MYKIVHKCIFLHAYISAYVIYFNFNTTEKQQMETMWNKTQNKKQDQQIRSIVLEKSVEPPAHAQRAYGTTLRNRIWPRFSARPDLEQSLTKTKKELRQAPITTVSSLIDLRQKSRFLPSYYSYSRPLGPQCGRVVRPTLKVAEVGGSCPCETCRRSS